MNSKKVDLLLRILLLPIANLEFCEKDPFKILTTKYDSYKKRYDSTNDKINSADDLYKQIYNSIYKIINKNQTIFNLDEINLYLKKYFNKYEIDELYESLELKKDNSEKNLLNLFYLKHINKIARTFLTQRDGRIAFKHFNDDKDYEHNDFLGPYKGLYKVLLFNSLNRFMCIDVLVCSFLLSKNVTNPIYLRGFYHQIGLEDMQLQRILEKGVSENHIHISAGTNFYLTWETLMDFAKSDSRLSDKPDDSHYDNFKSAYKIVFYNDKYDLLSYVKACSFVRVFLSFFMYRFKPNDSRFTLYNFYVDLEKQVRYSSFSDSEMLEFDYYFDKFLKLIECFKDGKPIKDFNESSDGFEFSNMNSRVIKYFSSLTKNLILDSSDVNISFYKDMMNTFYSPSYYDTSEENLFIFNALKYIEENKSDKFFSDLFFQYLRVKNETYNLFVQQNQIKGLENFKKYFATSTGFKEKDQILKYKTIFKNQFQDKNIRKLEIRKGISGDSQSECDAEIRKDLKYIFTAYKEILEEKVDFALKTAPSHLFYNQLTNDELQASKQAYKDLILNEINVPIIGLVYHFIKRDDTRIQNKCWLNYANDGFKSYSDELHFNELRHRYKHQIVSICKLRHEIKHLSKFIVGIDAASSENDTEPWVFAPIYKKARDYDVAYEPSYDDLPENFFKDYCADFYNEHNEPIKTLGFTFHAGEDFRHLFTGIRRVHETYEHLKLKSGDRIGHAIAIGIDAEKWCKNNPVVIMPRIERLENLLWIWGLCKEKSISSLVDERYLERTIMELAKDMYIRTDGITIYDLWRSYRMKFDDFDSEKIRPNFYGSDNYNCKVCSERLSHDNSSSTNTIHAIKNGDYLFCCETNKDNSYLWNHEKLFLAHHCSFYLKRMQEMIFVSVEPFEADIITEIQNNVLSKLSKTGVVIETNPTSNSALGEIDDIFDHYIKNLDNDDLDEDCNNSLIVTINSDDPSVFQTTISSEFAYIYYSLLNKGYPKKKILKWIDTVREQGMNSSFIKTRSLSTVLREVNIILDQLNGKKKD